MHYKNVNFLKYECPGGTQLPDMQQPAALLSLREPSFIAFVKTCRKQYPKTCLLSRLAMVLAILILPKRAVYF